MVCNDPRRSDEERARAALDRMDDEALAAMVTMMEEIAKKHPRPPRPGLTLVKPPSDEI